jgi:hypothetical protein
MKSEIHALVDIRLCSTMVPSGEKNLRNCSASALHWVMPLKWDVPKISNPLAPHQVGPYLWNNPL